MKKLFTAATFSLMACTAFAQIPYRDMSKQQLNMTEMMNYKLAMPSLTTNSRAMTSMYIDYGALNGDDAGYVWRFNSLYGNMDTSMNYAGVGIDTFAGFTDYADPMGTAISSPYLSSLTYTIDSFWAYCTHENNSGNMDYFRFDVVNLAPGANDSTTSNVQWEYQDSTNSSLSGSGNWLGTGAGFVFGYAPGFTTSPGQLCGLKVKYYDPSKTDSFSISATFLTDPLSAAPNDWALLSNFRNSWMMYPPIFTPKPTRNSYIYYPSLTVPPDTAWFVAQNWNIWCKVTFDLGGTESVDNKIKLGPAYPNPASGYININYGVKTLDAVTLEIRDITGKLIETSEIGNLTDGSYTAKVNTANYPSGIYLYTLRSGKSDVTGKFTIQH